MMRRKFLVAMLLAGVACGDSGNETAPGEVTGPDEGVFQDQHVEEQAVPDAPPVTDTLDTAKDTQEIDIGFPEIVVDTTPPKVVSTSPANEETGVKIPPNKSPFEVKVTFSEAIRFKETVDKNTFQVKDIGGKLLSGKFSYDAATFTVTWTADPNTIFLLASPYVVTLSNLIQDAAGNRMEDNYVFRFSTEMPKGAENYAALAAKYSPIIYQATQKSAPQFDYLTSFDFDGNQVAADNEKAIKKATKIPSFVYYDVVESTTHYFIRFAYFWPLHLGIAGDGSDSFGNDVAGATVVVKKKPEERPVEVLTYFGIGELEEVRAYATAESGLVKDRDSDGNLNDGDQVYVGVNWVFSEAEMFPAGHYQAYLTAQSHESCLWNHTTKENPLDLRCLLNEGIKSTLTTIRYTYVDGTAQQIEKAQTGFPASMTSDVGYGLKAILGEWWARRDHVGDQAMFSSTFVYGDCPSCPSEPEDLPGKGAILPNAFIDPVSPLGTYKGRPPWAWNWEPASTNPDFYYYVMPRGVLFIDPIRFLQKRHRMEVSKDWSDKYCYNPYLLIDQRDTAECK